MYIYTVKTFFKKILNVTSPNVLKLGANGVKDTARLIKI